ncbi:MAG TPA: FKBP-type peptidyl-prolyl cis-trans isomerase [Candidatus Sulfopaludibacter sp.]|nr:FKBP-type peptidyl-prolyl cis-trans isomerase [Candidatus Sulfopaludibacter sp.]
MKFYLLPALALGLLVSSAPAQDKPDLTNPKQRTSYAIGVNIGSGLKVQNLDLDPKALTAGITDTLGGKPALTQDEVHGELLKLEQDIQAKNAAEAAKYADGAKNLKDGEAFLATNKSKDGVKVHTVTLPNGTTAELQYKILKSGTGNTPQKTDTVTVNYTGTLIDGTVFDSSVQRGRPATFPVGDVIPGWTAALQMMKVGDKWQLFLPPQLAYGEQSPTPKIGPNSTLIFEVELLGIEK